MKKASQNWFACFIACRVTVFVPEFEIWRLFFSSAWIFVKPLNVNEAVSNPIWFIHESCGSDLGLKAGLVRICLLDSFGFGSSQTCTILWHICCHPYFVSLRAPILAWLLTWPSALSHCWDLSGEKCSRLLYSWAENCIRCGGIHLLIIIDIVENMFSFILNFSFTNCTYQIT